MVLNNVRVGPRAPRLASRRSLRRMIQATGPRVISPCPGLRTHLNSSAGRAGNQSAIRNTHPAASTAADVGQNQTPTTSHYECLNVSYTFLLKPQHSFRIFSCSTKLSVQSVAASSRILQTITVCSRPNTMMRMGFWGLLGMRGIISRA